MQSPKPGIAEVCLALCLACNLPLLVIQSNHLWERPHLQFFVIAWAAFAFFLFTSWSLGWCTHVVRQRVGACVWFLGLAGTLTAAVFFSPWIGQAAAILCITAWGLLRLETLPAFRWLGWTLLLWVTLPLPGNLDTDMVNALQRLSAQSASYVLDLIGILHLPQGAVLEIRSRQLFVDEACSGIDSLYSLFAMSLLMMVWQRRPFIIGLFTLLTVPLWAWFGNLVRLLLITVLLDRWDIDLSKGLSHTTLGLVIFSITSACLFATLAGFADLFRRFTRASMSDDRNWHVVYNSIVCFPGKAPVATSETDQYFAVTPQTPKISQRRRLRVWAPPAVRTLVAVAVILAPALALNVRSATRNWMDGSSSGLPHFTAAEVDAAFGENDFPEKLSQAERRTFRVEHRSRDSFYGEYSTTWAFRDSVCDFIVSLDFPFRGYHPLWVCYTNAGNTMQGAPERLSLGDLSDDGSEVVHVKFQDDIGNFSYLWFELFERNGQAVAVKNYDEPQQNALYSRLQAVVTDTVAHDPVSYQLQLYVPSSRELTKDELANYTQIFKATQLTARQLIRKLPN